MDLFEKTGRKALGSRLRMLTAAVTEDAARIYALYNIELSPKWFPVFFILAEEGEKTISAIATAIGHSQPSVSKIITEMTASGLVKSGVRDKDRRRNVVTLSKKGKDLSVRIREQYADVDLAIEGITQEATHDLWKAIAEWEYLLRQRSLFVRVQEQKKIRESRDVRIVPYEKKYKQAFRQLNEEWITKYFRMEAADYKALDNPQTYILKKGGHILVALYHDEPVGVCALLKSGDPDHEFELAKMAVSPAAQGKHIGWLLGQAAITRARELGAKKLYLESNTLLKPAISLYEKLGFQKIAGRPSPYERSNIQMALQL